MSFLMPIIVKLRTILGIPFVQPLITTLFLAVITYIHRRYKQRPFRALWTALLGKDQSPINIVLPSFKQDTFRIEIVGAESRIPRNVTLLPYAEAMGITTLSALLKKLFPSREIVLHEAGCFTQFSENFISIGGPSVNPVTHKVLNINCIDYGFKLQYPEHVARDSDGMKYQPKEVDGATTEDFGFIFLAPNPFNEISHVCVLCGVWANGTNSAIQAVSTQPKLASTLAKELKTLKALFAVTRSEVAGFVTGVPKLTKIRRIEDAAQTKAAAPSI